MADLLSKYTLDQIVQETLLTLPESQQNEMNYDRFFSFAIGCLREMRLLHVKDGKITIKINPNSLNRYDFPDDMEEFCELGVPVNGTIWWLTRNNSIVPTTSTKNGETILDSTLGEGVDLPIGQFDTFTSEGAINWQGYFTIDDYNREIIINANQQTTLFLRYLSSGISKTTTTYVPTKYYSAIRAYILWKDIEFDKNMPEGKIMRYAANYNHEIAKVKRIEKPSHIEVMDAWSKGNSLA